MNTRTLLCGLGLLMLLEGCSFEEAYRRNEDRYLVPGALDVSLSGYYDSHHFRFMDSYHIAYKWPAVANACGPGGLPTIGPDQPRYKGEIFSVPPIHDDGEHTWAVRLFGRPPQNIDRFVRSVRHSYPVYAPPTRDEAAASTREILKRARRAARQGYYEEAPKSTRTPLYYEEREIGLRPVCFQGWWGASTYLTVYLHKRDLATWQALWTERYPEGRWSERRVGANTWLVQEVPEDELRPRPLNGLGGPYQAWLVPIGDTGYAMAFELGASRESLQFPDALERFRATFHHLIESVTIEPLTAEVQAQLVELEHQATRLVREDCKTRKDAMRFPSCRYFAEHGMQR